MHSRIFGPSLQSENSPSTRTSGKFSRTVINTRLTIGLKLTIFALAWKGLSSHRRRLLGFSSLHDIEISSRRKSDLNNKDKVVHLWRASQLR